MNKEIEALIKKADESIKAAQLLFDNGLFGFAVSRAYYAMFYIVSAVLLTKGLSFSKHTAVVSAFDQLILIFIQIVGYIRYHSTKIHIGSMC